MIALLAALALAQAEPIAPEAKDVFEQRQGDLIALAGKLGGLHRLSQVCASYGNIAVFRDRMKELIDGERPPRDTREAMIAQFNASYRTMSGAHFTCSRRAETDFRREASDALRISERLSASLQRG
ncbi:TIGR02301 family protein [Parvularcula lutaonensis]|uniref:TIGR02301 family protein n=1 Tax=Parvularcula lutaonensis TaxID=491923 RepID=A0ABV7MDW3_9PROT|nr:TIGR02301 family protein [Parvularcula lutaonensis]GGY50082.1 hypothetical protein GCM10007148_18560 [Parvularcula lutaonensis]